MKCMVVSAHPLPESLCATLTSHIEHTLRAAGHEVVLVDLYRDAFDPSLGVRERETYYRELYDASAVEAYATSLVGAEALVIVLPTWWFGFPAILKGWFDRVWAPGVAYDHARDYGPIQSRLHGLRRVLAVTTLGAPRWVDFFVMRRPVRRILKIALLHTCAPRCSLEMLSLYRCEALDAGTVEAFKRRIARRIAAW